MAASAKVPSQTSTMDADYKRLVEWRALKGWPTLLGILFAAFVAIDMFRGEERGHELASILAASALVYLCASALRRPKSAWLILAATIVIITLAKMGLVPFDATLLIVGLATLSLGYGFLRGFGRTPGLPVQAIAMLVFGALAGLALVVNQTAGAFIVAAGLIAHAGWDAYHHRANKIVARSLAEFCFVLDIALAGAIIVATLAA